jgi:hypothetical protein
MQNLKLAIRQPKCVGYRHLERAMSPNERHVAI